jgi:hypothetical protein
VVPNFLEHALEKFELKQKSFGTILAPFFLGTRLSDNGTLVTLQLSVPSLKQRDVHTQTTKHSQGNKSFTAILHKFAKICTQSALELTRKQRFHVYDRCWRARFTPVRAPTLRSAHPRALTGPRPPVHRVVPIKQPQASAVAPRALSSPARAKVHRTSPRARRATARLGHRGQLPPVTSKPRQSLISFANSPWSFPSSRTRQNFTGDPRSSSPDFGHPRPRVDWAIWWATLKFLACTSSLISGEAPWPIQSGYGAVSRLNSSLPMSSPACARGPTYSDHRSQWSVPRRDRQRLPDLTRPLTGATSPPVSPSALFFRRGHSSIRGRIAGSISWNPRGFSAES